ncbi:MAG TPA: zinc-binding alcohol dehydrogenase, partial [Chloroflexota bacterium]|nr:zinc-binding alcohol dehydrogenase [Chloroflexota bacterium]
PRQARLEPFDVPQPARGQVLVRTTRTLVSAGTELKAYLGVEHAASRPYPRTTGYSHVGVVEEVGEGVTDVRVGDRVATLKGHASHVLVTCAPSERIGGIGPTGPVDRADWIQVLPEGISDEQATFAVLGSVAMHGVRKAAFKLDENCLLAGQGVVGQLTGQLAKLNGARPVIGMDLAEERLTKSRESGIDAQILVSGDAAAHEEQVMSLTGGRGVDVAIDCTATTHAFPGLLRMTAMQGRIVILGSLTGTVEISLFEHIQLKELTIIGVHQPKAPTLFHPTNPWTQAANRRSILELIAAQRLRVDHLISHVAPADEAPALYELMGSGPRGWLATIFRWDA